MTARCGGLLGVAALLAATGAAVAQGVPASLELSTGKVRSDAAGAFISVSVKNSGTATIPEIMVSCDFTAKGRKIGTSSTTLFSTVGGTTGSDQVRLLGGTSADGADCKITGTK